MRPSHESAGENVAAELVVTRSIFQAVRWGVSVAVVASAAAGARRRLSHHASSSFRSA